MPGTFRAIDLGSYTTSCPADEATLLMDGSYRADGTRRGVIVCHSAGQRHHDQTLVEWWPVPRALAESGRFVCLACDFGDPTVETGPTSARYSWGNDNALLRMTEAYQFLVGHRVRAKGGPVLLVATSMGAVLALNWSLRYRDQVSGVILACPVLDLMTVYCSSGASTFGVGAAYGVRPPVGIPELSSHSPAAYAPQLSGLPIRIYASHNDPIAADAAECQAFAERVGGGQVEVIDLGSVGHWPIGTPVDDAMRFADQFA